MTKPTTSLLTALRKFRPRENRDPLEDFITEAFAWLLQNYAGFSEFFLQKVSEKLSQPLPITAPIEWSTQVNLGGKRPDLVADDTANKTALIFENKAWSPLHHNQLENYREGATEKYGEGNYRVILITASITQHHQGPDAALLWSNVHGWIKQWQKESTDASRNDFLIDDFCNLLIAESLGPPAPIAHEAILSFQAAKLFEVRLGELIHRNFAHDWNALLPPDRKDSWNLHLPSHRGRVWGDDKWGRIGIYLLGDIPDWHPGLFAGFLVDTSDHCVEWLDPRCPDFSIIVDVNAIKHPRYESSPSYTNLRDKLKSIVAETAETPGFHFLDHLEDSSDPNRWHPIHIRMSMLELFRGTQTPEEQDARFIERASSVIQRIASCEEFWLFREELQQEALDSAVVPVSGNEMPGTDTRGESHL